MDAAFETIERSYLCSHRYPKFFDFSEENVENVRKLFITGYCYPFAERDEQGRRIVLVQSKRLDINVHSVMDAIRVFIFVNAVLIEEEETQIAGIVYVFDYEGVSIKQLMNPMDLRDFMDFSKNCALVRQKGSYLLNVPSFAHFLMEIVKSLLSEKLKSRVCLVKTGEELKDHITPSLLPKEFGGVLTESEMLLEFKKLHESKKELMNGIRQFKIDWNKVPEEKLWSNVERETVGSFRKLDID